MKQISYKLDGPQYFQGWVAEVLNSEEYRNGEEILFKFVTSDVSGEDTREIYRRLKKHFPKAKIVGISMTNFVSDKLETTAPEDARQRSCAVITCCYFDSTKVTIFEKDARDVDNYNDMAWEFNKELKKIPDLKGVEILCSHGIEYVPAMMEIVTRGLEDVPFFGALAGVMGKKLFFSTNQSHKSSYRGTGSVQFVSCENYHEEGIILIAYSGEDLHIKADYNFGWKPIGKEMTATDVLGVNCLAKVDDVPATQIYKKYLNVDANEYLLFNVFDFPFVVNRGGLLVARVADSYDDEGRLYMTADLKRGEKIRLSYGNLKEILCETWKASEEMRKFNPQGISLYICGARTIFLDDESYHEIRDFSRIDDELFCCFGGGEIYKYRGKGGQAATALISIGFREGESCSCVADSPTQVEEDDQKRKIPLSNRLASFLKATTDDLIESNEKFKEAAMEADAANKAKSKFLSNMSHEIRTPINAILGMDEMILREAIAPNIVEYAENIQNAGNTLLGIVNDILDFSKIEAGKMEIIPVEYSLSSLLNDLVNMIQTRANKKGLTFKINAERTLPTELYGDEIRLKQIVTNILTNAVKYTENGSVILTVTGKKVFGENKIKMIFSVKDTGIGIKEEDIKKLFSAFERIEEKRNRSVEGTGLGMNITQRLLTMMGSTLQVHSVYGEGSEFTFEVEQKIVNPHPLGNFEENYKHALSQHKKYREKFTAPKAKILVVDDTVMNLTVVKGLLKQTKIQIDTADSGYEALTMVTKKRYDLIFLDHRMPGLDGIETLQHMKDLPGNLNHDVPTISLTANAISGARKQYIDAGFQDYLTKPIDSDKLESMLIEYLPAEKVHLHKNDDEDSDETADEKTLPDWLNSVEGLNAQDGIKHCGSVDAYLDALTVFAQSVTSGAKEIADFYKNEDWKNYTTKVHALKSSARVIGANELSSRALRLEDAGNSGYINEIKESTDYLLELYISFADKLAPLIKTDSEDDENKPLIGDDELAEAYETLKEVAATFDYDTLMFVIQSVEEYKLPDAEKEKFSEIKSAAAKPDWETLQKLLK
ncbi:MAG: response regulator [Selenomonadaceae bacterium]|nr:response regulator [Selenomonadaceae bacterium]